MGDKRQDFSIALLALRHQLITREDFRRCAEALHEEPDASAGDLLVDMHLLTASEVSALSVLRDALAARGCAPASAPSPRPSATAGSLDETVDMRSGSAVRHRSDSPEGEKKAGKYIFVEEIGRGGIGAVHNVFDADFNRHIAMKVMIGGDTAPPERLSRFLREAKLTGQLEHPNIVPAYSIGKMETGEPYFTMRLIKGRSLSEVLKRILEGETEIRFEFTRWRLLSIFQAVCMAMAFSHDKGIIHRDLKPENVMIGDFGEVLVVDWGLAKFKEGEDFMLSGGTEPVEASLHTTSDGTIIGTPLYMAPEQAQGKVSEMDELTDIYQLGGILYEILALRPPFEGKNLDELLDRITRLAAPPPSAVALGEAIPKELDDICMKAMSKSKQDRYETARALHDSVRDYIEGAKEKLRKSHEALAAVRDGKELAKRYYAMRNVVKKYENTLAKISRKFKGWEPVSSKKELWAIEDQIERMYVLRGRRFADAVNKFVSALELEENNPEARRNLADLYFGRFLESEAEGDVMSMDYFLSTAKYFNDGQLDEKVKGDGVMEVATFPAGALVYLYKFVERDRILTPKRERFLGTSPIARMPISMGSYLLVIKLRDYQDLYYPLFVGRQEDVRVSVELLTADEIGPGFAYIPGGKAILGGDQNASLPRPRTEEFIPTFFIARFPVTCSEYLEFLNSIPREDAFSFVPGEPGTSMPLWPVAGKEKFKLPEKDSKSPIAWLPDKPVVGVNWHMANAYVKWKSEHDGRRYKLPSESEWEKAARGADGRFYPWGNKFESTYCNNSISREGEPTLEPVGAYPTDRSPFGVRDMAGGVKEWLETPGGSATQSFMLRGGSWAQFSSAARAASRFGDSAWTTSYFYGLRLASSEKAVKPDRHVS